MPFVGTGHIWLVLIVLAIVLIVKGPGKLPEMGQGMGRAIREFRAATRGDDQSAPSPAADSAATEPTTPITH